MITGDDRWYQVCKRVNDAVYEEIDANAKPCRSGVVPGLVAWDDCTCGILATTWAITMASEVFPQERILADGNCDAPWEVMEMAVQLIRCAPSVNTVTARKTAPSVSDLEKAAVRMDRDQSQVIRAMSVTLCTMKDASDIIDFMVNRSSALGPEGGCVGFEARAFVALPRLAVRAD